MPHSIHIRWGMKRDIPAILACGTSWSEADFLTALRYRDCISMCAEHGDESERNAAFAFWNRVHDEVDAWLKAGRP